MGVDLYAIDKRTYRFEEHVFGLINNLFEAKTVNMSDKQVLKSVICGISSKK